MSLYMPIWVGSLWGGSLWFSSWNEHGELTGIVLVGMSGEVLTGMNGEVLIP